MEEDCITLSFNLADSRDFAIGDYIDDEIFGRFTISEEPVPADYDPVSGAHKYELRFDADWIYWKNYILMFTSNGVRRETTWVLTDTLDNHLSVVLQNLQAIGYTGYSKAVENTVEDPGRAVCLTYSGTSILDALKALAEAYKCEFWLTDEVVNNTPTRVIHFGKCQTGTEETLSMTDEGNWTINVENMVPTRNESEYGNRFYVYGSTKNIPDTYRKHLAFKVDEYSEDGTVLFRDSVRSLSPQMFKSRAVLVPATETTVYAGGWSQYSYNEEVISGKKHYSVVMTSDTIPVVQGWAVSIHFPVVPVTGSVEYLEFTYYIYDQNGTLLQSYVGDLNSYGIGAGVEGITIRFSYHYQSKDFFPDVDPPTVSLRENTGNAYIATLTSGGSTAKVALVEGGLAFLANEPDLSTAPAYRTTSPISGFGVGAEFTLSFSENGTDGLLKPRIPISYYTDDGEVADSVSSLGERRLMLPRSPFPDLPSSVIPHIQNGYVQRGSLSRDEIVERVVFFDEIYPRCALRVTSVEEGEYANDTTYSDGSKKIANLPAYILQAERIVKDGEDEDFPFDPDTMMVVGKLTATFLTPDEAKKYSGNTSEQASLLMGMTFDVACNRANGVTTYQLAWNSDYGDKLPNEILKPKRGDAFVLAGWDPSAMSQLGLIKDAENELAKTADLYAELLEDAQFAFECHMMSDWIFQNGLFPMGQKVLVHHNALSADKHTRVIGFEYKLDIPYDTPVYTVGESDAYSRLREIEKSLNAQSSVSAANGSTSVNISSQQDGVGNGGATLHLVPGSMVGMSSVDYDGSEEKTARIPSVLDHLVDADKVPRIADDGDGGTKLVDKDGNEVAGKQFFELVPDEQDSTKYSVKLKSEYTGLWAEGWGAFGGIGTGSGGGGMIQTVYTVSDLGTIGFESVTETFSAYAIDSIYKGSGASLSLATVSTVSYLKDSLGNYLLDSNGNRLALPGSSSISRLNLLNGEGAVLSSVDLDLDLSAYVPTTRKINGHPLTSDVTLSATADLGVAEWALGGAGSVIPFNILPSMYVARTQVADAPGNDTLLGVDAISYNSVSGESDASRIEWLPDAGGVGVGAWHLKGNLYVDGWLAAAGIGTGSGGSGGGGGGASYLDDLEDVDATSPSSGDLLAWNGNEWANSNNYYTKAQVVTALGTSGNYLTWTKNGSVNNITVPFATSATNAANATRATQDGNGNTISTTYALASSLTEALTRIAALEGLFELVDGAVHVKNGRAFYADLWVAAGGVGTAGSNGGIYLPDVWASLTNTVIDEYASTEINPVHIPSITTSKVSDINNWITTKGVSIAGLSVNIGGSITTASLKQALGISGDETPTISSVVLTNGANYSQITVDDTSASFYTTSQVDALIPSLANYLPLTGGTMTGALLMNGASIYPYSDLGASLGDSTRRFNNGNIVTIGTRTINFFHQTTGNRDVMLAGSDGYLRIRTGANTEQSYKDIIFHETYGLYPEVGSSVNLGYHSSEDNRFRWATIYGVNEDLTGNLSLASSSHIDIGPLRIEYDPDAKALHITKVSANDTNNYGIYTDGILVGGGIQEQTT